MFSSKSSSSTLPQFVRFTTVAIGLLLLTISTDCKKKQKVPTAVNEEYQKTAHSFCQAIVHCIKEDLQQKLAAHPERSEMVSRRMSEDLCLKQQYNVIGKISVDPGADGKEPAFNHENYQLYGECARAVIAAPDCSQRLATHRTHAACQQLRRLFQ